MKPTTQLYMLAQNYQCDRMKPVSVKDEREALSKAIQNNAFRFSTYEISSVEINGQLLKGNPENVSPYRYVNVEKIYSLSEVLRYLQKDIEKGEKELRDKFYMNAVRDLKASFQNKSPSTCMIPEPGRPGDWIELKPEEKVFNPQGHQIFPKAKPATLKNRPQV